MVKIVITKGISVVTGVSFLLPFISSLPSSFSTVLMCFSSSSELYPSSRNRCLSSWSDAQSLLMLCRFVWFVVLDWMEYGLLTMSDVLNLCEGSSVDWFVFCISWCKVYYSWYAPTVSRKEIIVFEILYSNLIESWFVFNSFKLQISRSFKVIYIFFQNDSYIYLHVTEHK